MSASTLAYKVRRSIRLGQLAAAELVLNEYADRFGRTRAYWRLGFEVDLARYRAIRAR